MSFSNSLQNRASGDLSKASLICLKILPARFRNLFENNGNNEFRQLIPVAILGPRYKRAC